MSKPPLFPYGKPCRIGKVGENPGHIEGGAALQAVSKGPVRLSGTLYCHKAGFWGLRPPDRVQRVEQGAVRAVVGAEIQRRQELRHHPAIVRAIRGAHGGVDAPALRRAERPGLSDQCFEGLLADDREYHLAHDTLGAARRGLDHAEQDAGLAAHLARLLDQFIDDAALGLDGNPVRHLNQQLD